MRTLALALVVAMSATAAGPGMDSVRAEAPHLTYGAPDSERFVLVGAFANPDWWTQECDRITEDLFRDRRHRAIARALQRLIADGRPLDLTVLVTELGENGGLEEAGGLDYVGCIDDGSFLNEQILDDHLRRVEREAIRRGLYEAGGILQLESGATDRDPTDILDAATQRLEGLRRRSDGDARDAFTSLSTLLEDPDLLKPPEAVLPKLGYRGRLVVLAGPDKIGKSTFVSHGAAAKTVGSRFLGQPCDRGRVVHLGLEEAVGDAVRRYAEIGAEAELLQIVTRPTATILQDTRALLSRWPADVVVVDSLTEYGRVTLGTPPDDGDNAGWAAVIRPLVALAREHDVAVIVLHHVRRSDGQYRGAGEIAAAADAIFEMSRPSSTDDPRLRRIQGRGRWDIQPFSVVLEDGRYQLGGSDPLSLDARVYLHVQHNPGTSTNQTRQAISGRASAVDAALNRLERSGEIVNRGSDSRSAYHVTDGELPLGGEK